MCTDGITEQEAVLTLCEDEVVLLDETLEGVLLKVDNVGSGGQGGCAEQTQSCEVAHCDVMCEEVKGRGADQGQAQYEKVQCLLDGRGCAKGDRSP